MKIDIANQKKKAEKFQQLHYSDNPLILPNVWEPLATAMLQELGFEAAATSSSAMALTHGYHDGEKIPFNEFLSGLRRIANAVEIPVSADIESGFAANDNQLVEHINAILEAGIIGINFEDTEKTNHTLLPLGEQARKITLIRKTADEKGIPLFINARVDTYVSGGTLSHEEKMAGTIKRAKAYQDAGANGIFPILLRDLEQIKILTDEIDLPVNIMAMPGTPDFELLKEAGVKRVSLGSSFLKIAMQELHRFANQLKSLDGMGEIEANHLTSDYLNKLIK